jgi:hypothetical protein
MTSDLSGTLPGVALGPSGAREDAKLAQALAELAALEAQLAQRELELATLRNELLAFETRYLRSVGPVLRELDEVEAEITEALAAAQPDDAAAHEHAQAARRRAQETAETLGQHASEQQPERFMPSERLKKLYRETAKRFHPDLAADEVVRERRQRLMAEVNAAYNAGDECRLADLLASAVDAGEQRPGDAGTQLARVTQQISNVTERISSIAAEIGALRRSDLFLLRARVDAAEADGRDLLAELREEALGDLAAARQTLRHVTARSD